MRETLVRTVSGGDEDSGDGGERNRGERGDCSSCDGRDGDRRKTVVKKKTISVVVVVI